MTTTQAKAVAHRIIKSGEALSASNAEIRAMAEAFVSLSARAEAQDREIKGLKAFVRGIGIHCQRASADLSEVSKSAAALTPKAQP